MTTKKTAFAPVKIKRNPQLKKVTGLIKLHRHSQAAVVTQLLQSHQVISLDIVLSGS